MEEAVASSVSVALLYCLLTPPHYRNGDYDRFSVSVSSFAFVD